MDRATAYRTAKNMAQQLNIPIQELKAKWKFSTKVYWNRMVRIYNYRIQAIQINKERKAELNTAILDRDFVKVFQLFKQGYFLNKAQARSLINSIIRMGRYFIVFTLSTARGEFKKPVNDLNRDFLTKILTGYEADIENDNRSRRNESDEYYGPPILNVSDITHIRLERYITPERVIPNRDGNFFTYINTTKIDLSKYQIYNQEQAYNVKDIEQCLIYALGQAGINKAALNQIKLSFVSGSSIRKTDLPKIANIIGCNIVLHYTNENRNKTQIYKTKLPNINQPIDIAIYDNHYFVFEKTIYARFAIENYEQYKDIHHFAHIYRADPSKTSGYKINKTERKTDSLTLINTLFKNGYFKRLDMIKFAESATLKDHIYLDNIENEQHPIVVNDVKDKDNKICFADFEAITTGDHHELYLAGMTNLGSDEVKIFNTVTESPQNVINHLLDFITENGKQNGICYFHNLKYDYHLMEQYINIKNKCVKNNQLYSVDVEYKSKQVVFVDSFKMINMSLSKFQAEFKLNKEFDKKEAIAYTYYNKINHNQRIKIEKYAVMLTNQDKKIFKKQVKDDKSYDEKSNTFNPLEYYKEYLRLDCLVLKKGMEKFNKMIEEITENALSIYDFLTISSLTDRYMKISEAYNGVYEIGGNLRAYIAKAVYGGRVHVNEQYKKKVINKKIADYDGVSLYPSAINRLCREMGLPKGAATRFKQNELNRWKKFDYAIMTVKINKVNKYQAMPFIALKSESSIEYINEAPQEPIIIDSITLEDYINFHKIDYEILDGVYWNQGFNKTMGTIIQKLFLNRLKCKRDGNTALSNVIKLMLNSSYGKTIMKKTNDKHQIIRNTESKFDSYIYNHFNTIKGYRKLNDFSYEVESICADHSYNRGHIGCAILSMSKRIMNEVFDVANTKGLPFYYTDTDSIHCNYDDVKTLEQAYKAKYNKDLNGKNLEQFHVDFDLKGAVSEVYSTKSIFLGKKSYIDCLESTNKKGKTIHGYHVKLKGITEQGLNNSAREYKRIGLFGLYDDLRTGKAKTIILNPVNDNKNQNKVLFEFKEGKVSTRREFTREVSF